MAIIMAHIVKTNIVINTGVSVMLLDIFAINIVLPHSKSASGKSLFEKVNLFIIILSPLSNYFIDKSSLYIGHHSFA